MTLNLRFVWQLKTTVFAVVVKLATGPIFSSLVMSCYYRNRESKNTDGYVQILFPRAEFRWRNPQRRRHGTR
jgi:hypothetical protein